MNPSGMNRRDFQRLTLAALGGMAAGVSIVDRGYGAEEDVNPLLAEPHVCRGLNTCKAKGAGKENACAGMGICATATAHECATLNSCKGQGGCGAAPGENKCKSMGQCAVPLKDEAWKKARKRFEELMTKAGKQVGPAPAKK